MARSSSLYAVFQDVNPIAGFTVRHELITWLKRWQPEYLDFMHVYKFPDGASDSFVPFEVDIVQLLKDK
jgi:hypothetical protein